MFKRCKVVMLPTNQKAHKRDLVIHPDSKKLFQFQFEFNRCIEVAQHLYILSDDEIKVSDWYMVLPEDSVRQCNMKFHPHRDFKKIIASTDPSLSLQCKYCGRIKVISSGLCGNCGRFSSNLLPSPSQSFIEKYVEEYNKRNKIEDIMIEYEEETNTQIANEIPLGLHIPEHIKINSKDNTITIKKIKDSWTREEVVDLINKAIVFVVLPNPDKTFKDLNKWIETNL
jgi:hypothetical protein